MLTSALQQPVYNDIQGLTELKAAARKDERASLETVAKQFESIFLQMMLKSMRQASLGEGIFDSQQSDFYRDMYDQQLAVELGNTGGIGLAEMMVRQLQQRLPADKPVASPEGLTNQLPKRLPYSVEKPTAAKLEQGSVTAEAPVVEALNTIEFTPGEPDSFIQALRPHAEKAAARLGVAPEALLAQAALETGWGRAVIPRADGSSSFNLFNIKADHRWDGERVAKQTLEYRDGIGAMERASFRAYGSFSDSFADYADFIASNPRYQEALAQGGDARAYAEELQKAGYATDPNYAEKIGNILRREPLFSSDQGLKVSPERTLNTASAGDAHSMNNGG